MKLSIVKPVFFVFFYIIILLSYNYYSYNNYKNERITTIDEKLKLAAYTVYYLLGENFFLKANTKSAISTLEDMKNIQLLTEFNDKANLAFVYASIKKHENIYLISSSASEEELANNEQLMYFHRYDSAKKLVDAFEGNEIIYEVYSDNWGMFRAVHIPITLKNNHKIVVSSEISLAYFNKQLDEINYTYLLKTFFIFLIIIPIAIAFTQTFSTNKKLEMLSYYDKLTGIANRRIYDERVKLDLASSKRLKMPLSMLMLDIDFFKQYNDRYGHLKGDKALMRVAKCLSKTIERETDLVARYGGEEFVVLLVNTPIENAIKTAEKIIDNIESEKIKHAYSDVSQFLTVSIGVASTELNPTNLAEQADKALYQAKENGRNKYEVWS